MQTFLKKKDKLFENKQNCKNFKQLLCNIKFSKTTRPHFSDKGINSCKLFLEKKGKLLVCNHKIAKTLLIYNIQFW